jgi:hypothetical protein
MCLRYCAQLNNKCIFIASHVVKRRNDFAFTWSRDSSICITLGYGPEDRGSRVRFPAGAGNFSLHHRIQNGSGAHPTSYPMGTRGSFLWVKQPGREADHSLPSSAEVKEWVESYLHSPSTPSWRGAQLKHRDNFTFLVEQNKTTLFCGTIVTEQNHSYSCGWVCKVAGKEQDGVLIPSRGGIFVFPTTYSAALGTTHEMGSDDSSSGGNGTTVCCCQSHVVLRSRISPGALWRGT